MAPGASPVWGEPDNTFAAYPSMRGLGRFYELDVRCRGEVVNVPDAKSFGMGVRFLDLAPTDREALDKFVGESA